MKLPHRTLNVHGIRRASNRLFRLANGTLLVFLVLAVLLLARGTPRWTERAPTAGLDIASFEAYGDPKAYWATWTLVHSSQSILRPIAANLVGDHRLVRKPARALDPIENDRRIRLVGAAFYDITGRPLTLSSVVGTVHNASSADTSVPRVLHYFLRENLTRMQSVCVRSAVQQIRPAHVFVWLRAPSIGGGVYWSRLLINAEANGWSSRIILAINRYASNWSSEVDFQLEKIDALLVFGGIALDPDVLVLKSPQGLLRHRVPVLGFNDTSEDSCDASPDRISVDAILSPPMSPLLFLWRLVIHYARDLADSANWAQGYDASSLLRNLHDAFPDKLRLEGDLYLSGQDKSGGYFIRVP